MPVGLGFNGQSLTSNVGRKFALGKSITSHFQNLNSSSGVGASDPFDAATGFATSMIDAGVSIDDAQVQNEASTSGNEIRNYINNQSALNHATISNAENTAVVSARKPWEVTDAQSDYAARLSAVNLEDAHMQSMLNDFATNSQNALRTRSSNEAAFGGMFGAFGRFGAALYDTITNDKLYKSGNDIVNKMKAEGFDPLLSSGQHVKVYGDALPDDLGTSVAVGNEPPTTSDQLAGQSQDESSNTIT